MLEAGQWTPDAVGGSADNEFETRDEAEAQIPSLAQVFECSELEFRVVEWRLKE